MKKVTIMVVTILAVVLSVVCLTACGDRDNTGVAGTWKLYSMTIERFEGDITITVGDDGYGVELTEDYVVWELKKDGSFLWKAEDALLEGSWRKDGNNVVLTINKIIEEAEVSVDGKELKFALNGDMLSGDTELGYKLTMKKSK